MKTLVIGADHFNTLNIVRALGQENIEVDVIIIGESKHSFVSKSKYISRYKIVNKLSTDLLVEHFSIKEVRIPVIATTDAAAVFLDQNYNLLSEYFILPSVKFKEGELIREMDKSKQLIHAKESGFIIPTSKALNLDTNFSNKLSDVNFPCIIKPEESYKGSKNDFRICYSREDLMNKLNGLKGILSNVLVQQFIPNDEVILVAGVRTNKGKHYLYGEINKLKNGKKHNNLGLLCFGELSTSTKLHNACIDYLDRIDYHGLYSIEVLRPNFGVSSSNNDYFLEINLRTDSLIFLYTKAGINYPAIWVKSCYGVEPSVNPSRRNIYGMNVIYYIKNTMGKDFISDLLKTDVFSLCNSKDIKPILYRFINHIFK